MFEVLEPALGEVCIASLEGEVDEDTGKYLGKVLIVLDTGATYEGSYTNGLMNGKGIFIWKDGVKYEGDFVDGIMSGECKLEWPNRAIYTGSIADGKRNGYGKFENNVGQLYDGDWIGGKREGYGVMYYNAAKTVYYDGYWYNGYRSGCGVMHYLSGNMYEGEWEHDKKCGRGIMSWRDRHEVYVGDWADDRCEGYGEHFWDGGETSAIHQMNNVYRGQFHRGLRHGMGTFFYSDGSQYSGVWVSNKKHDPHGLFRSMEGYISIGVYSEDKLIRTMERSDSSLRLRNFSSYHHLNILDVLCGVSACIDPTCAPALTEGVPDMQIEVGEIERVLLRYDAYIKKIYRHYRDMSNSDRLRSKVEGNKHISCGSRVMARDVYEYLEARRGLERRLFCMSLTSLVQFGRECKLIDSHFSVYDMMANIVCMQEQQRAIAFTLVQSTFELSSNTSAADEESDNGCERQLDMYIPLSSTQDIKGEFGLTERDFAELLVRCYIDKSRRKGRSGDQGKSSPSATIHLVLAQELLPFSSMIGSEMFRAPDIYEAMYNQRVLSVASSTTPALVNIWQDVCVKSGERNRARVVDAVNYILTLRDGVMAAGISRENILRELNLGQDASLSQLLAFSHQHITIDGFFDIVCRALLFKPIILPNDRTCEELKVEIKANDQDQLLSVNPEVAEEVPALSTDIEALIGDSAVDNSTGLAVDLSTLLIEKLKELLDA